MFVISVSSGKFKRILCVVCVVALVIGVGGVAIYKCSIKPDENNTELTVNNSASDITELLEFISNFGWEVKEEPDDVREIIIPSEFDEVYKNYNEIQLSQGYDLTLFAGQRVKKWSFTITNYEGYENTDFIKINILVSNGSVVGGDVCSVKFDGFMHGFSKDD